jgi:V/A-type H+-transporting ATPase subunit I
MAPFFLLAFGIMIGDIMYGAMITLGSWYLIKKMRPAEGGLRLILKLGFLCGISAAVWGVMFGGFFGNAIPAFTGAMLGREITLRPFLFDPITQPVNLLIMALAFGFIQICYGLCLKAYSLIKHGRMIAAVCDVGFHLVLLSGAALCVLSPDVGLPVMATGALGIVLTAGRAKSNIFVKILSGLGTLYNCVNYLSDTLSYSRLLGLGLASAVIAQVFNTLGTLVGPSIFGWILFIVMFFIGHVFNLAINLLGAFVHSARLQFIEFFSKFYESGGRPFTPLFNRTKYVEMIKEA